jgi:hypothetical protein
MKVFGATFFQKGSKKIKKVAKNKRSFLKRKLLFHISIIQIT